MLIGIGGSAANPTHLGHLVLLKHLVLSGIFQKVVWMPSGIREDKKGFAAPEHRVRMTQLAVANLAKFFHEKIELLFDDAYGKNHPTIWWLKKFQKENPQDTIAWYTGVDSVVSEEKYGGKCEIEARWVSGKELMRDWKFIVVPRKGFPDPRELSLPKQFEVLNVDISDEVCIKSSDIRDLIAGGRPFEHLVTANVADYIKANGLYGYRG